MVVVYGGGRCSVAVVYGGGRCSVVVVYGGIAWCMVTLHVTAYCADSYKCCFCRW